MASRSDWKMVRTDGLWNIEGGWTLGEHFRQRIDYRHAIDLAAPI